MNLCFLQGLLRKPSRWTYMSDLIALIRSETDTRRIERTLRRGREEEVAGPTCRPPGPTYRPLGLWAHLSASASHVGSPPPPRLHLRRSLSRFDPRAHDGRSSLYKQPYTLLLEEIHETLIHIFKIRASNQEKISPP